MGLAGSARLVLHSPVIVTFECNRASSILVGASSSSTPIAIIAQCQKISIIIKNCFFEIENEMYPTSNGHLNFVQNYANKSGTVLYGGSLQLCRVKINGVSWIPANSFQFFKNIIKNLLRHRRG